MMKHMSMATVAETTKIAVNSVSVSLTLSSLFLFDIGRFALIDIGCVIVWMVYGVALCFLIAGLMTGAGHLMVPWR